MKKVTIKCSIYFIVITLILGALWVAKLYNDFFPIAEPIELPSVDNISEIEILKDDYIVKYSDRGTIKLIIEVLLDGKGTRRLSVHDKPIARKYYIVNITKKSGVVSSMYIYEEESKWYIEQPYWGIYEINKDNLTFIKEL